jgi:hypothetical protein
MTPQQSKEAEINKVRRLLSGRLGRHFVFVEQHATDDKMTCFTFCFPDSRSIYTYSDDNRTKVLAT